MLMMLISETNITQTTAVIHHMTVMMHSKY